MSQREYEGTSAGGRTLISSTDFTYADKTNYLTGIKHYSPLGTQDIGYTYGNLAGGYMPDQVYKVNWNGEKKPQFSYDGLGRLVKKACGGSDTIYTYEDVDEEKTTTIVKSVQTDAGTYTYTYDNLGNILSITDGTYTTSYVYDSLNQLIRENDERAGKTYTYAYTNGNITSRTEYAYTTEELGETVETKSWQYNDSTWADLLTDFNGETITYDEIGNPLTMGSKELTWLGRQLQSITDGEDVITYAYNGDGQRVSKTVNGTTTEYYYNGSILAGQKTGDNTLVFMYDNNGDTFGFTYNGTEYYYIKNAQNDVMAIADASGNVIVNYYYDAWGKVISITDANGNEITDTTVGVGVPDDPSSAVSTTETDSTIEETTTAVTDSAENIAEETTAVTEEATTAVNSEAANIARINPIRYRSYYYDAETDWYYLNTRYYSADMCRFLNADGYVQTGQGMLDKNMFAYCMNSPISRIDQNGNSSVILYSVVRAAFKAAAILLVAYVISLIIVFCANNLAQSQSQQSIASTANSRSNRVSRSNNKAKAKPKAEAKSKEATRTKERKQEVFPINPYDFHPRGLVMREHAGTRNGRIIEWRDPTTNLVVFEWDEDLAHTSHYHAAIFPDGKLHNGLHYMPETPVPEPLNSIYFGGK